MRATVRILAILQLGLLGSAPAAAQQRFIRLEGGQASLHAPDRKGMAFGVRLGRSLGAADLFRADIGASWSKADEGYITLDLGGEFRPFPRSALRPFIGAGLGLLGEPEFGGPVGRANAGLDLIVGKCAVRFGLQGAWHGGTSGPDLWYIGLEF